MSEKICKKCGHVAAYEGAAPIECPGCGAIYAKVEEALRAAAEARAAGRAAQAHAAPRQAPPTFAPKASAFQRSTRERDEDGVDVHAFAKRMRAESLYPTWRQLVVIYKWLGYALALLIFGAGIVMLFTKAAGASTFPLVGGLVTAVVVKAMVELSLMMADMSDASVRMAARGEG